MKSVRVLYVLIILVEVVAIVSLVEDSSWKTNFHTSLDAEESRTPYNDPAVLSNGSSGPIANVLHPNLSVWINRGADDTPLPPYRVITNAKGYREEPFNTTPPDGTTRILVIGDSYTFGWGVNASDRYTDRVEDRLNRIKNCSVQVLNLAVPGYGVEDYFHLLKHKALGYRPDHVVIGLEGYSDIVSVRTQRRLEKQAQRELNTTDRERIRSWVRDRKRQMLHDENPENTSYSEYFPRIGQLSARHEVPVMVYLIWPIQHEGRQTHVQQLLTQNNLTHLPPPSPLLDGNRHYLIHANDAHYNANGHKVLAEGLAPVLAATVCPPET